jgi:hypothetical protein
MSYQQIKDRFNAACNWFADTAGVDYTEGWSAAEVRSMDAEHAKDVWIFPELKKMGY